VATSFALTARLMADRPEGSRIDEQTISPAAARTDPRPLRSPQHPLEGNRLSNNDGARFRRDDGTAFVRTGQQNHRANRGRGNSAPEHGLISPAVGVFPIVRAVQILAIIRSGLIVAKLDAARPMTPRET
jgi:hypothetical protein